MTPILTARHAELVAAREQNSRHILELRGLLAERLSARLGGSPCPDDDAGAEDSAQ